MPCTYILFQEPKKFEIEFKPSTPLHEQINVFTHLGDSRNSTTATDNVQWTFWGWGGQPLDVMVSFSVAAICVTRKYISQAVN